MAFLLDGKPLAVDVPFTVGDINYPANWLRLSSAQEKKKILVLLKLMIQKHMTHVFIGMMELQKHLMIKQKLLMELNTLLKVLNQY